MVVELDLMAAALQARADNLTSKVAEVQGIIDSMVRDMRKLQAIRELEEEASRGA